MKVVVDTNILFSGILNPNGTIGDLLLKSNDYFTFYAPYSSWKSSMRIG